MTHIRIPTQNMCCIRPFPFQTNRKGYRQNETNTTTIHQRKPLLNIIQTKPTTPLPSTPLPSSFEFRLFRKRGLGKTSHSGERLVRAARTAHLNYEVIVTSHAASNATTRPVARLLASRRTLREPTKPPSIAPQVGGSIVIGWWSGSKWVGFPKQAQVSPTATRPKRWPTAAHLSGGQSLQLVLTIRILPLQIQQKQGVSHCEGLQETPEKGHWTNSPGSTGTWLRAGPCAVT